MTDPIDRPALAQPGYRREALPDPESVGEDAVLVASIRAEIETAGPITFARFMERALYEPGHGYYRRPEPGPGRAGDFLTAPEAHPIFGAAIGRLLEQAWDAMGRPSQFTVSEPGAGAGALAAGLLGGLRDLGSPMLAAIRYRPVELEPARVAALRARLAGEGLDGHLEAGDPPATPVETGAVVANEVIDALPVHRVVGRAGGIRELLVGIAEDGAFEAVEAALTTPALAERLAAEGVTLADGQVTEVCLAVDAWLEGAVRHLRTGVVVLVDYADEPAALHGPGRMTGTLRAFARHAVGGDPFRHVGRQDLTATVDLGAVRAAAVRAGLDPLGETTQAELLAAVGSAELTDAWLRRPGADLQDALRFRSAVMRLMDPRGMGGFRVLVYGRGLPPRTTLPALARARRPGSPRYGKPDIELDRTPLSIGVEKAGDSVSPLITKGTLIPVRTVRIFTATSSAQTEIRLHLVQGESAVASENASLCRIIIDGIRPVPEGVPLVEVTFDIDPNGIFDIKAKESRSGRLVRVRITASSMLSKDDVDKLVRRQRKRGDEVPT